MQERCCVAELRNKEVINICDGRRLGCVIDVEFNACDGRILSRVAQGDGKISLFGKCDGVYIPWCKIQKIGDDIILVDIGELSSGNDCCDKKKKFY